MKDVVSITQGLFALSKVSYIAFFFKKSFSQPISPFLKNNYSYSYTRSQQETARLESENYVQQQKIAVASELKSVLDSWVRYEQQVKEREQADLTKSVIDKVIASLKDEKVQRDILVNAVAEIEREYNAFVHLISIHAYFVFFLELVKTNAI